ncbi:hypothetical protein ACT8ZV_00620 [Nocardioides sp. MAHUQ-72]|uniref:hypothetical protein n=1 Tax=unclassified Nocardioides TaxID=2615069 RepID=UPI00361049D0
MSRESMKIVLLTCALVAGLSPALQSPATAATPPYKVLFDNSSAETAGNADWIISTSQPDPLGQNAGPTSETSWTGAISAWGVALQRTGDYSLETLPATGRITYGDATNSQDLANYDGFVLPEPNTLFTAAEKTAIMKFVQAGGGLFMVSDHDVSDRNNDGYDSVDVLNDLMTDNSVDPTDPFGFAIDHLDIGNEDPGVVGSRAAGDPIVAGPFGEVTGTILRNGTTATLHPTANGTVRGELYRSGYSASGTTGAAFVTSSFGSGRVAFWGDSSPIDDGTGQPGNTLYDGWNDPAGTNAALALNATQWLVGGSTSGGGTGTPAERVVNGGFESGNSYWSLGSGASVVTTRAYAGTHSLLVGGTTSSTQSATQQVTVPTGASSQTLTLRSYVTTQESGSTAYDRLNIQANGTTLKSYSNASPTGTWTATTVDLSAYAGQTITLKLQAVNDSTLPTSFYVDVVSVMA